jgi:hypothetical protein
MTKKIVFGAALVLVIAGLAAPNASALCNPPKFASTYNSATLAASYWHTSLPAGSTLVGKLWSSTGDHTGTCNTTAQIPMLYFGATPGDVGFTLAMGDPCVVGCPSGSACW